MKRIFIVEQPLKKLPGVYKITCEDSDKIYIGESVNISQRIQKHFSLLRHNKHSNPVLQNMFNKHGEEKFHIWIIEYTKFNDELELKKLEQKYQKECPNCISLDSNEIFAVKRNEEWKKKQGEFLNSFREENLEKWRRPIIIYDIKDNKTIEFKQLIDACSLIEQKHLYRNIKEKILVPYKHRYVAFLKDEFTPELFKNIIYSSDDIKVTTFKGDYILYNLITGEEKHYGSKRQFSLAFSDSINDGIYKYYSENNLLDFNFRCTKFPKNKKEFLNFTINPSPTLNKRVWGKLEDWYNGLLKSNNKKDIERLTNFKRGCIDSALEARNKIEWIKIIEKVLDQLPD